MTSVKTLIAVLAAVLTLGVGSYASENVSGRGASRDTEILGRGVAIGDAAPAVAAQQPVLRNTAEKRRWLRNQVTAGARNNREVAPLLYQINQLTPQQVDVLTNAVLAQRMPAAEQQQELQQQVQQLGEQQQQLLRQSQQELARLQLIRQALENELWLRTAGYTVGYQPVITWLPDGTAFGAAAVVSPDGRHVRMQTNPFFSSVGPVYTYNLNTGETRPWTPQPDYQPSNQPLGSPGFDHAEAARGAAARHQPQAAPAPKVRVWPDVLGTRGRP